MPADENARRAVHRAVDIPLKSAATGPLRNHEPRACITVTNNDKDVATSKHSPACQPPEHENRKQNLSR